MLALTRAVPASIAECELTHLKRETIDWARATEQHSRYEAALESIGCRVQRLPPEPGLPDSVFVEDAAIALDECAIITRPGAPTRRRETASVAEALRPFRRLLSIEAPGTLDGGDVLRLGRRVYVGISSRTNAEGARQLDALLRPLAVGQGGGGGYNVQCVTVRGCLHLKTAVSALGNDRVLLNPQWADGRSFGGVSWIEVDPSEPFAANVVHVNGAVLCPANAPRTQERLSTSGYRVLPVDASELAKAEAGLTCCSILLHDATD
jgi:dimethylargininase